MSLQDIHDLYSVPHIKSLEIKVSDGSTLRNPDLVVEKAELTDSLSSASELMFGSCEAACLKLQVATADKEYKNLWLDVWATVQENSGDLMIDDSHYLLLSDGSKLRMHPYLHSGQIGRFKVVLDEPVADRSWRNLTCYDAMYDILRAEVADWYNGLTFPMTVKALRDSFFEYLEIEQEETTLIHDSLVVQGNFVATSKLTGRTIIKAICELGGVFGHINPEGKFAYLSIPSEESVTYSYYRDGTGTYERDVVEPITGIIARDAEDDAGTIVGTLDNPYIITGNPLVFGIEGTPELEDVLDALLTKISAVTYRPFSVTSYGNPFLPVGTSVVVNTKNMTINSLIMTKRLSGIQALKDSITAKGQKERLNDTVDLSSELYQTDGRYHLLRNDVNGLESEVFDEQGNSKIEQISNEIVLKVDSNGKIVNVELTAEPSGSAFKVLADNIDFISNGKIQLTSKSLEINSTNFTVDSTGKITAKSGTIGGWSITTNALYNGMTSLSDTTHDGVWIGQDGIALGKGNFKATKEGAVTAKNINITGGSIKITTSSETDDYITLQYSAYKSIIAAGGLYSTNSSNNTFVSYGAAGTQYKKNNADRGGLSFTTDGALQLSCKDGTNTSLVAPTFVKAHYFNADGNGTTYYSTFPCIVVGSTTRYAYPTYVLSIVGSAYASGSYSGSSIKIKENIKDITEEEAKKILSVRTVSFDYKESYTNSNRENRRGVIAEEVAEIYPNVVNPEFGEYGEEGFTPSAVNYTEFIPYLIKMVQLQQKQIEKLTEDN